MKRWRKMTKKFNLVTDSWIKVINIENEEEIVSLQELFSNIDRYQQLSGEIKSQDLAILRFLLAILLTVYSRVDANGDSYDWIDIDENSYHVISFEEDQYLEYGEEDLLETWHDVFENGHFTKDVITYLNNNKNYFDFFDIKHPFYQITKEQYNSLVPSEKAVQHGKGTVALMQINRTISESNNSPDVFSPVSFKMKNNLSVDALIRWIITYQNFTATTDKTKIKSKDKFSISSGWLYNLKPVYVVGQNLFETLMLNLVIYSDQSSGIQYPVWELPVEEYIEKRKNNLVPDNLAELYTLWSRALHIDWESGHPIIFSAGLPKIDSQNVFIEPMTTWKKTKDGTYKPNVRDKYSINIAMWRNFGEYVNLRNNTNADLEPGIVSWVNKLVDESFIKENKRIYLMTVGLISDGNNTSQLPVFEFKDEMKINAQVLFDKNENAQLYWPARIEGVVELTNIVGNIFRRFIKNIGDLRNLPNSSSYANKVSLGFYERLNKPFNNWLENLTNDDERDKKVLLWKQNLNAIVKDEAFQFFSKASPQDIRGRMGTKEENIFIFYRQFLSSINKTLNLPKECIEYDK